MVAKPLSGVGLSNTATTVIAQPNRLRAAIVASRRPNGFTHGDFRQIKRQKTVGTESRNSTVTKSRQSTVPRIFNNPFIPYNAAPVNFTLSPV